MRTLFLNPPSFEGFDGGASSRWPASREIESYWYPVWLTYPAGMLPDSKLLDAPPHKVSIEQTVAMAKDFELLVLFTSTPGFHVDAKMASMMKDINPKMKVCFVGSPVTVEPEKCLRSSKAIDFVVRKEFDHQIVDFANGTPLEERPGVVSLPETKRAGNVVKKNSGCSLIDLGDGVLNVEFHSKMNSLGEDQMGMVQAAFDECKKGFQAVVIGNQGELFSAGANLMMVLMLAQDGEFDDLDIAINRFQQSIMSIKYAPVPVVVAAHSKALGGGCEMILHGPRVQVSAELYTGLVEVGVGLIPGGGGCKEMILRHGNPKTVFETIGYAKVSTSAEEARKLGFLDAGAGISMNGERLIGDAKVAALALAQTYKPSTPREDVKVAGLGGLALLKQGVWLAHQGGYITDYDQVIGENSPTSSAAAASAANSSSANSICSIWNAKLSSVFVATRARKRAWPTC